MIYQFIAETLAKYETALQNLESQIETQENQLLRLKELYFQTSGGVEILRILKNTEKKDDKQSLVKEDKYPIDARTD